MCNISSIVGTWNAKFYALKQSINVKGEKFEALSLVRSLSSLNKVIQNKYES